MTTEQPRAPARRTRHPHDDAPDTAADFARAARLPDGPEKERILQQVATAWLPMAQRLARKYRNRGENVEDLEQVAALALVKSVERYDPTRGHAFESFAVPNISGELKRHFRDNMWDVHVPRRIQDLRNRVRSSLAELEACSERSPTVAELAAHTGLSEEDVQLGMEALYGFNSLSLDAEMAAGDGDSYSLLDTLGGDEDGYDYVVDREAAKTQLCHLSEREQHILYLRFFEEMTQSEIAREIGVSQMHISRLISGACRRVRENIDADLHAESEAGNRHELQAA